jgi:DNA-binding transcriptional ArsR family regulator
MSAMSQQAAEADVCQIRYVDTEVVESVLCNLADRETASGVADLFRVLADPTRVLILHALSMASLCNCDLASILRLTESAVSHQMRELRMTKLVTAERRGRMVYYRLSDSHVRHVLEDTMRHAREAAAAATVTE